MKATTGAFALTFITSVAAHGFVRSVNVDGAIYPGFNPHMDGELGAKRIVFGFDASRANVDGTAAITDPNAPGLACNSKPTPPGDKAEARAGSQIEFRWTEWLPSHRGPITTYMAPYEGDIAAVDVNKLQFFKIDEEALYADEQFGEIDDVPWAVKPNWATDKMIQANGVWNVTIPWDIKPGNYVVRHELLALHFATEHSNYKSFGIVAPQFYPSCYHVGITGNGTATPTGVTFPGTYQPTDPGLIFDIYQNKTEYPIPGPAVYLPKGPAPELEAKEPRIISPTGDPAKDAEYMKAMEGELSFYANITNRIYKVGG
ncbi:glycoside hydrolase [Eremomyces bilateralis CBS 781.70]|uniref:lytic cellulose monooxygenase (C4-dehydrogenating) n=1 Tax=Eremomyces bilateralis CBS 781.70 TaxID=1392243 RepID=A0A6G1GE39_9PEZI|nr:glycoside hydrolase [Eremomyces bilateralis CBS 781.70]KAF1816150.1 glycoside hydrolase [Eremomyces bilateralis CBS 781.70]